MTQRVRCVFLILIGVGVLLSGCATTEGPPDPMHDYDPSKPRILLPGAEIKQAKSVAMGAAASKGWKVTEASENRILATRSLDAAVAQELVTEPVSSALLEVGTDFYQRREGVEVLVGAELLADRGQETEQRIDFTSHYASELNASLNSLSRIWQENRQRVAGLTPPLPIKVSIPADEAIDGTPIGPDREAPEASSTFEPDPADGADAPSALGKGLGTDVAPVAEQSSQPLADTQASAPAAAQSNMVALDRAADPGVWAYYAEYYAQIQGCAVSHQGAVLEQKTPEQEIHRVYCDNGESLRVSCNAGTCRGIQ